MSDETCSYVNCTNKVSYIVTFGGMHYLMCKAHFRKLINNLTKIAVAYGKANMNSFSVRKERGKIRLISPKKVKREKFLKLLEKMKKHEGIKSNYLATISSNLKTR